MPVRLFASRHLEDFLTDQERDLTNVEASAVRDQHFQKKVRDALREALVNPLVFDRFKAKFVTKSVADGGVSVTLKIPYRGDRGLFDCSTNGYVFERFARIVAPTSYDFRRTNDPARVPQAVRLNGTRPDPGVGARGR